MKTNKLLTTLAIVCIASVALFTGCNKDYHEGNGYGRDNDNDNSGGQQNQTTTSLVNLGTASTFAVLGGTTVTNVPDNASVINGDAGVGTAGNELTGFQPEPFNRIEGPGTVTGGLGLVSGTIYAGGAIAAQAHNGAQAAYLYLMAQTPDETSTIVTELNGETFTPGVYKFQSANLAVNGTLTLDFGGDPNALFIFQTESTLVTKTNSNVVATNFGGGATTCFPNVFWAVGSSATISGAEFIGTVIALTAITMTNSVDSVANVAGRLLALGAEVTIINSTISTCGTSGGGTKPPKPCRDFVTGGGWIGDKATFGVSGGIKNGKFWGQLSFNDHDGIKIKSTEVTGYTYINATTRRIDGLAKVNGRGSYAYSVVVTDNGEPGRDDHFILNVNIDGDRYHAEGDLKGGNIQLHKECGDSKDDEHHYDKHENDGNRDCDNDRDGDKDNHGGDKDNHGGDKDNHGGNKDNHGGNDGRGRNC